MAPDYLSLWATAGETMEAAYLSCLGWICCCCWTTGDDLPLHRLPDPIRVRISHCRICLRRYLQLLSGKLKIYVKTGESGTKRPQSFCPECGTPIYSSTIGEGPKVHVIRVGTARQRDQLVPKVQLWCRSSQIWLNDLSTVPKIEKQPVFDQRGGMECTT